MWHVWGTGVEHAGFWWGNLRERDHLEDLDADGNNIKMHLQEIGWGEGTHWIDPAQDRDKWRSLVNAVMNLRFP